jgi:hypothetical protein
MQAQGLLTGKFTLHAQTPTVQAGVTDKSSRMIYPAAGGTLKLVDAKAAFTDVLEKSFDGSLKFDSAAPVTPGLPTDWLGNSVTIPSGVPITLTVHLALVAEVSASRDNQFKASVGAFAKATSSVGVYVFSKLLKPCTETVTLSSSPYFLPTIKYKDVCLDVLKDIDASMTENHINTCTVPSNVEGLSGSCSANKWLVMQKRTGPTVVTGFSAPTLTAANKANIVFGVGFYPMCVEYFSLSCVFILTTVSQCAHIDLCRHLQGILSSSLGGHHHSPGLIVLLQRGHKHRE